MDLSQATEDMLQSAHVECEVFRDGDVTLMGSAIPVVDATEELQLNKPMRTKAFKAKVGGLGKLRVEIRLRWDSDAAA